jgi:hypothetical protein
MRYYRATEMIFPRLPLMEFEGIRGQYFAIGNEAIPILQALLTTPHGLFCGHLRAPVSWQALRGGNILPSGCGMGSGCRMHQVAFLLSG